MPWIGAPSFLQAQSLGALAPAEHEAAGESNVYRRCLRCSSVSFVGKMRHWLLGAFVDPAPELVDGIEAPRAEADHFQLRGNPRREKVGADIERGGSLRRAQRQRSGGWGELLSHGGPPKDATRTRSSDRQGVRAVQRTLAVGCDWLADSWRKLAEHFPLFPFP